MKNLKITVGTLVTLPEIIMKRLGITWEVSTPQSMYDEWWFWNCTNIPDDLPDYISELNIDPLQFIGYGLSQDEAVKILDSRLLHNNFETLANKNE